MSYIAARVMVLICELPFGSGGRVSLDWGRKAEGSRRKRRELPVTLDPSASHKDSTLSTSFIVPHSCQALNLPSLTLGQITLSYTS